MHDFVRIAALVICGVGASVAIVHFIPQEYVGVCTNTKTHVRLVDKDCQPITNSDDDWAYYLSDTDIPAVGGDADDGAVAPPDPDHVKRGGVPAEGQQAEANSDVDNGNVEPPIGGADDGDVGVNSGDEDGSENVGSGGGGEDGE